LWGVFQTKQCRPLLILEFPVEATQRFEDLVTQAQRDFVRWGASDFRVLSVVSNPCEYRAEIIFSSKSRFREFESEGNVLQQIGRQWTISRNKSCSILDKSWRVNLNHRVLIC
jgi:hypothetical protein